MKVHLRKIEPRDVPFLYQWENDAAVWADGANHNPVSQQDLRDYVAQTAGDIYKDGQLRLIIEVKEERSPENACGCEGEGRRCTVGCADLFDLDVRNRRAAIGLYIAADYRGKGYAAEVLSELERYAFLFLHLRVLYAVIGTGNTACMRLFEKAGYTLSGTLQNWTLESDAVLWLKTEKQFLEGSHSGTTY